jgi:hypothetical protein
MHLSTLAGKDEHTFLRKVGKKLPSDAPSHPQFHRCEDYRQRASLSWAALSDVTVFFAITTSQHRRQDMLVGLWPLIRFNLLNYVLQDDYCAELQHGGLPAAANSRSASHKVSSYGQTILTVVRH